MKQLKFPGRQRVLVTLALLVLILPVLPLTASAGQPLGTPFPIRAESEVEVNPAIAYNSQDQQYLIVLWNDRPGCDDVRAERIAADSRSLGGKWVAAGCPAERRYPDVAYNSKSNEYLVVWVEESGGINYIKLQRLSAEAQLLGGAVTIVQDSNPLLHPAVAYAFTSDKYLVVWEDTFPGGSDIIGRVISAGGQPEPSWVVISQDPGGQPRQQPDLAYNRHANGFLVVWQQWDPTYNLWDIHGRLVNGDGGTPFASFVVDNWMVDTTAPAVAAIPSTSTSYKYLVVWEKAGVGDRDIYARLIEENGTPAPGGFYVSVDTTIDESAPAVAGDEAGQRYLVTWRHPLGTVDVPIHGRAVSAEGSLMYDEAAFGGPTADSPAVAAGSVGTFLVAWQDKVPWATETDIWGQLWGNRVYLPIIVRNRQ
jgi:hypothetical protein